MRRAYPARCLQQDRTAVVWLESRIAVWLYGE